MMHRIKDAFTYELRKRHKCSLLFEGIITSFASVIKTVSGNERQFRCFIIIFEMKDEKKKEIIMQIIKMFRAIFPADSICFIE